MEMIWIGLWILIGCLSFALVHAVEVNNALFAEFAGVNADSLKSTKNDVALAYLMLDRDPLSFHWISHLQDENVTVFLFVDRPDQSHIYRNKQGIYVVSVSEELAKTHGYSYFGTFAYITKPVTSWDKVMFFFCKVVPGFRFLWVMESDVFIPSLQSFHKVHQQYVAGNGSTGTDLIISSVMYENNDLNAWHWRALQPLSLPPPWYHSMACVMGLSRKLLHMLDDFASERGRLEFLEYLPLTMAMQQNLSVVVPKELGMNTITHKDVIRCEDVLHQSMNWFHPIKRPAEFIGQCIESGEWPVEFLLGRGYR